MIFLISNFLKVKVKLADDQLTIYFCRRLTEHSQLKQSSDRAKKCAVGAVNSQTGANLWDDDTNTDENTYTDTNASKNHWYFKTGVCW